MRTFTSLCLLILVGWCARGGEPAKVSFNAPASSDTIDSSLLPASNNETWWRSFDDPMLDSLIAIGQANNYNLAAAAKRIDIARSEARTARGAYSPTIGVNAGWTYDRQSGLMAGRTGAATAVNYFNAGATMSWEIDVFGKIRAQVRKADRNVKVSAAEYAGAMIALDAEIATTYINLLVERQQLEVAREHTENQAHLVKITEVRYNTGLASKLDVAQAKTLYNSTIASIPLLEASIESSYNELGVLTGLGRDSLPEAIYNHVKLPPSYQLIATGGSVDLLRRRPDIVEAERDIDVAAAQLGIARTAYLPSLSLTATASTAAHNAKDLFKGASFTYNVAPTLTWTVFDGLQRRNTAAAARQAMEAAVDNYNMTVLTAVEEVRSAVSNYKSQLEYISRIEEVVKYSREEVRLSVDQYKQGLTQFSNVVDAQLNYLSYQNTLVQANGNAIIALINLYKALGGGWSE